MANSRQSGERDVFAVRPGFVGNSPWFLTFAASGSPLNPIIRFRKGRAHMPVLLAGTSRLAFEEHGSGQPVVLIPPAGARAGLWTLHQVPAIVDAGYRAVLLDTRGTDPLSIPAAPFRLADLAADAACLITELQLGPCLIVGASLGAMVAQELALRRPDLLRSAVLLGTRCRTDFFRGKFTRALAAQVRRGEPPSELDALMLLTQLFSATTLADDAQAANLLALVQVFYARGIGPAMQYEATIIPDRTNALRQVACPCLVVAFAEDSLTPPALCREVAAAIPRCRYVEIDNCGHFGFLERPEQVNATLMDFFSAARQLPEHRR
jgi:pimeloyl-ACP methyl ester carboxylesterase